ncbi:hypothetical protein DEO23_01915 [Brachybacterium endophyticum]|uniref:Uncharacterized protein n=1 Tax=Brachybacterium endophyticum TaxID=2182385 RepID=A0A2U2RPY6_9MICO|nr:DUF6361 family protein [Brachybacterium endophyticum]PWH07911.1 hypothetical protein DEO23_01915 [Brachybacterium endophyticum]
MPSTFAWLAVDPEQRRRMMEAVEQFRDETTIDDLGVGGIRDVFSDELFPGISTIQTRLRYVLFVPWLLQEAARAESVDAMAWRFHDLERDFIEALKRGMGESEQGIIGRRAGRELQRVPSVVYWGALTQWGIVEPGLRARAYFQRTILLREQQRTAPHSEDGTAGLELTRTGLDPHLPEAPHGLLREATFELRSEDVEYLRESISRSVPRTLLARLVEQRPAGWTTHDSAPAAPWAPEVLALLDPELDARLRGIIDLGSRFSLYSQGANLLYNLVLAEATTADGQRFDDDRVAHYRDRLREWAEEVRWVRPLGTDDMTEIAQLMAARNRRFTTKTRSFLSAWFDAARSPFDCADSAALKDLVRNRERDTKGQRARLRPGNRKALDAWPGETGTGPMLFRWGNVTRHLQDLYDAAGGA